MNRNIAPINKIIPISSVDGPGARTSIFFQRCNIACLYCHNPETINMCNHCGICVPQCPSGALSVAEGKVIWDEEKCIQCDNCIAVCPYNASPKILNLTVEELLERIKPNFDFVRGITVSGGECSLYPDFLAELFAQVHNYGLTCLMDSNGMTDLSLYPELLKNLDGVMLDVKAWEQPVYRILTKASNNNTVKKNLLFLSENNLLTEIRVVYVPDYVDAFEVIEGIAELVGKSILTVPLKLISFRNNGVRGILANHRSPTWEEMAELKKRAEKVGFEQITIV